MHTEEEPKNGGPRRATESQEGSAGCVVAGSPGPPGGQAACAAGWGVGAARKAGLPGGLFRSRDCLARSGALPGEPRSEGGGAPPEGSCQERAVSSRPRGPRTYVCAPWGGAGRVHGTGRTRASACARFRAPLRTGPAPPGENAARSRGADPEDPAAA